jgi:F1F0 ATPase subunit 2
MALGGAYFLALWATVRRVVQTRRPGPLFLVSYLGRLALAAAGFYGVVRLVGVTGLGAALVGFLVIRYGAIRRIAPIPEEGAGAS